MNAFQMNASPTVLVVDDDPSVTASLALLLKQNKYHVIQAADPASALRQIEDREIHLVLQDMNFSRSTSGEEGLALLKEIRQSRPQVPVILMTAWASISLAVEGMRVGASDFISKPWDNDSLLRTIATAIGLASAQEPRVISRKQLDGEFDFGGIIGESPSLVQTLATLARVSRTDASILILGESGTGKEVLADAIHLNSARRAGPLVKVNLGGITPSLFESEMFGHVKGAFTDAKLERKGRFHAANSGTLFLDEIGELDTSSQVKLLRVLQDHHFQMVGSSRNESVDIRIISATNRDLEKRVQEGMFREDLFYRINLITIRVPPLRERMSDIPLLASHHLEKVSKIYGLPVATLTPGALSFLQQQPWPGNIRQLFQCIERTLLITGKTELDYGDFAVDHGASIAGADPSIQEPVLTLEENERRMIQKALQAHEGNLTKVAESLGLSRAALYRRLDKHGFKT